MNKNSVIGMIGVVGMVVGCCGCSALPAAVVAVGGDVITVIEGALCSLAAKQPDEPTWEDFLCTVAGDDATASMITDGGTPAEPIGAASFIVKVPAAQAAAFAAAHGGAPVAAVKK